MTTARALAFSLAAIVALSACGNDQGGDDSPLGLVTRAISGQVAQGAAAPQPTADAVAIAALSRLKGPIMVAEMPGRDAVAALVPYGQNGSVQTWTTVDFQTISLRDGRIVATRGLGADLMALGQSGAQRSYHLLDAANGEVVVIVDCAPRVAGQENVTLSGGAVVQTTRIDEPCRGEDAEFVNQYWIGTDGSLRRSRQWIGPQGGLVELQRLR